MKLVTLIQMSLSEAYSKVPLGKSPSHALRIQNDLKLGDAPLL